MARLGGAAALEEDLYGVDLTEGDPQAIPRCQYCDEPLSVGRRLKRRRFCSEEHEEQYRQQQSSLVFSRLRLEDRPRARPRRLWDPRNTEGCGGFEQMPVPPKPGRLTLYPAGGIQFSISPSILRFGGEILKLASGGAVARPRLRGIALGGKEVAEAGKVELKIGVPPCPAVICRLGEPAPEPPGRLIVLPGSAGCTAIREDLPEAAFVAEELLRLPPDAGFLDYPRAQVPERFRRPLWMPRMAVSSLGPVVAEGSEIGSRIGAGVLSAVSDEPSAKPIGRMESPSMMAGCGYVTIAPNGSQPPALVSERTWIGVEESPLLPRAMGPPWGGERVAGSGYSKPRVFARIAGRRVPGWFEGESGELHMPRQPKEAPHHAAPEGGPVAVSSRVVDRGRAGRAERDWAVARMEAVLPDPDKIRSEEQLKASVPRDVARGKDCRRDAPGETFLASGSHEAIFPRMGAVVSEGKWGAAGFRAVGRTREFSILPRGTADGFLTMAAGLAVPKMEGMRGAELIRSAGCWNPLPVGLEAAKRSSAAAWKQEPAPVLVRRALPWKAPAWTGRGGLAALTSLAPSGWRGTTQGLAWQAEGGSRQIVYPAWPLASTKGRPLQRGHLHLMAARGLQSNRVGNGSCGEWRGGPGPLLPGAGQSRPEAAVLGRGYLWPVGTNPKRWGWAVRGEPRFAGAGRVKMPKPLVNAGAGLLRRAGDRVGEWTAKAGVWTATSGEWRERPLTHPQLPGVKDEGHFPGMRQGGAAALGWSAGGQETGGCARELVMAYRFVFPAAAATELEVLPARRRSGARGKIVVLR